MLRSLPLRRRMTIAVALAVAVSVALAAAVAYIAVRDQLISEVDGQLADQSTSGLFPGPGGGRGGGRPRVGTLPARRGGPTPFIQVLDTEGNFLGQIGPESAPLPIDGRARDVAAGVGPDFYSDAHVSGTHIRMLTTRGPSGFFALGRPIGAIQYARSLEGADSVLH